MSILFYEFCLALSRLWRRRTQSGLMLVTFTVSIALSLLSWSLFHSVFLQNPEFDSKGELLLIGQTGAKAPRRIIGYSPFVAATRDDFNAWKSQQTVFSDIVATSLYNSSFVSTENGLERLLGANVSADALRLTGAKPLMGRLFLPVEDNLGCTPVIMISERTWKNKYAGDPNILGRVVKVDGTPATIVGVMPSTYRFPNDQEIWQPLGFSPFEKTAQIPVLDILVRLKPGITLQRAVDDLQQITARRGRDSFAAQYDLHPVLSPFREYYMLPDMHQSALVLFALSLLFVIVSCANAANLVMIDFFGRSAELASSLSLGIPRSATFRGIAFQLFIAAALASAIACMILISASPQLHGAMERSITPYWFTFHLQWHHFAVAAGLAALSALVAIIVPAGYLYLVDPEKIIRSNAGSTRGSGRGTWRRLLLIGQLALLTVLAVSAGLLMRSSQNLSQKHWGFDAGKIFTAKTAMKDAELATSEQRLAAQFHLMDEAARLPGVVAAAAMSNTMGFSTAPNFFYAKTADGLAEGRSEGAATTALAAPEIFNVLGIPFIEGETFSRDEKPDAPNYAVINLSLAQRLWPGQSAIGRTLYARSQNPLDTPRQIVIKGVVRDFQAAGPKVANNDAIYTSIAKYCPAYLFLFVRGEQRAPTSDEMIGVARRADPRLPIYLPNTMKNVIETDLSTVRLTSRLTTIYALAAVLLCAVGVYSITVSQILQRSREFGIRMALGIDAQKLWERFTRGHLITAGCGIGLGLVIAFAASQVLQTLLFGVKGRDPLIFLAVAAIILAVSALACVPSLFRLKRINPADCLRSL